MGGRKILKEKLKYFFQSRIPTDKVLSKKTKYLIIVALLGLLLLILGNAFNPSSSKTITEPQTENLPGDEETAKETISKETTKESIVAELETSYEKDLQTMLNNIKGVSEAEIMIQLDSTDVKVYEKDLIKGQQTTDETDKNGGIRKVEDHTEETNVVLVRQGDQEVPLLVQTKMPEVRGVFVVAKGVDHATVKMWVLEAVSKVLDVPTHKVSVMPKN